MKDLTFITSNAGKAAQLSKYLGFPINNHKVDLTEIQSLDITEVTKHKAVEAYNILKVPVIVDDNGLTINALGNLPGPFIKYFLQEMGNQGVCDLVKNYEDKSAQVIVSIGYCDGKSTKIFTGITNGHISNVAIGNRGFGWDQIFIPKGYSQTCSQMNEEDYDRTSPRKLALEKFEKFISNKLKNK